MTIRIIKKASTRGHCVDCANWSGDPPPTLSNRKLKFCKEHVCYTPPDGACRAFVARKDQPKT